MKDLSKHRQRIVTALDSLDAAQKRTAQHLQRTSRGSRRRLHSAIVSRLRRQAGS